MEIDGIPVASRNAYGNPINPVAAANLSGKTRQFRLHFSQTLPSDGIFHG